MLVSSLKMLYIFILLCLLGLGSVVRGQQGAQCSAVNACLEGCCSKDGRYVYFHSSYEGCQGTCDAIAQCGQYSNVPTCPLNVCCSQDGFCGTTADFCGDGCQNGCEPPT
jgi:chitinase